VYGRWDVSAIIGQIFVKYSCSAKSWESQSAFLFCVK